MANTSWKSVPNGLAEAFHRSWLWAQSRMNGEWIWGKQMRTTSKGHKLKTVQGLELTAKSATLLCPAFQTSLLTKTEADLEPGRELNLGLGL